MNFDFCEKKTICLTKALLISLSEDQTKQSGFNLYKKYLRAFVLSEHDTNLVAHQRRITLENEAIKNYYKKNQDEDPAFFNFFNFNVIKNKSKQNIFMLVFNYFSIVVISF